MRMKEGNRITIENKTHKSDRPSDGPAPADGRDREVANFGGVLDMDVSFLGRVGSQSEVIIIK